MSQTHTYRFNLWGVYKWIPVAIRRICVKDETCCECKKCSDIQTYSQCVRTAPCPDSMNRNTFCFWKPAKDACDLADGDFRVFDPSTSTTLIRNALVAPKVWGHCDCCKVTLCEERQYFDRRLCKCVCNPIKCINPKIQDPDTCKCVCPKRVDCGPFRVIDPCTCRCKCKPFFCFFPFQRNLSTCTCECPRKRCPPPLILDQQTCKCRCRRRLTCNRGYYFNTRTCRCEYLPRGGG